VADLSVAVASSNQLLITCIQTASPTLAETGLGKAALSTIATVQLVPF